MRHIQRASCLYEFSDVERDVTCGRTLSGILCTHRSSLYSEFSGALWVVTYQGQLHDSPHGQSASHTCESSCAVAFGRMFPDKNLGFSLAVFSVEPLVVA